MERKDVEQVVAIDRLSFSLPWPEHAYHYELSENPSSYLLVAEANDSQDTRQIAGVIVVWLILDEAHIATLAVHPDFRRVGIGRRLFMAALREGIRRGARQAMLEVRAGNLAAQALYRQFGFEVTGRRLRYYQDNNEDAVLMTLKNLGQDYLKWLDRAVRSEQ